MKDDFDDSGMRLPDDDLTSGGEMADIEPGAETDADLEGAGGRMGGPARTRTTAAPRKAPARKPAARKGAAKRGGARKGGKKKAAGRKSAGKGSRKAARKSAKRGGKKRKAGRKR